MLDHPIDDMNNKGTFLGVVHGQLGKHVRHLVVLVILQKSPHSFNFFYQTPYGLKIHQISPYNNIFIQFNVFHPF